MNKNEIQKEIERLETKEEIEKALAEADLAIRDAEKVTDEMITRKILLHNWSKGFNARMWNNACKELGAKQRG